MDTAHLEKKLLELQQQIKPYTIGETTMAFSINNYANSSKTYIILPVIVLILLVVFRPGFIYTENDKGENVISYKKVIMYWLIFSSVLCLGLFGYNYKMEKKLN